eukprot:CAMPEP_0113326260 /NCGR_PEP_ID=MMETSP0010_2-20120614/18388_1 /TAXON_ID=216773 ORGANISM="Corethron hystrix, Strain 308" /NCGR_SAMPLE_ID=MMETSP0010_2 /ASSEMBLY_ACC=CAM_ASM_000155 /LENGTH=347 /DNA_ID=CAMNT_0000186503 /DNA_START=61 /DNA_END=1104 /DNA_ORIENTATION=+ /assembly_acc=CAM_ASM_000155
MTIDHNNQNEIMDILNERLNRGEYLRKLRKLIEEEELSIVSENSSDDDIVQENDVVNVLSDEMGNDLTVLQYDSFLSHQRYYDDCKHIDISLIDYNFSIDTNNEDPSIVPYARLLISQDKTIGKPGMCWDAGFILAEHVIAKRENWISKNNSTDPKKKSYFPRIVELGAGTGLAGIALAKALKCHVTVTDLPEVMSLIQYNIDLNFKNVNRTRSLVYGNKITGNDFYGEAVAKTLRWGHSEDYDGAPYDVIVGGDVIASLYDPVALAMTFYALSGPNTSIYVSYKRRLDEYFQRFEIAMKSLFNKFNIVQPRSRNINPDVMIIEAGEKAMYKGIGSVHIQTPAAKAA